MMEPWNKEDFEAILRDVGIYSDVTVSYKPKEGEEEGMGNVWVYTFWIRAEAKRLAITGELFRDMNLAVLTLSVKLELAKFRLGLFSLVH